MPKHGQVKMFRLVVIFLAVFALEGQTGFDRQFERIKQEATPAQLYAFLYAMPKGGDLQVLQVALALEQAMAGTDMARPVPKIG